MELQEHLQDIKVGLKLSRYSKEGCSWFDNRLFETKHSDS